MPTVAIASEFLDAFARIPRAQQRKVREFTEKFKADPKSAAQADGMLSVDFPPSFYTPRLGFSLCRKAS